MKKKTMTASVIVTSAVLVLGFSGVASAYIDSGVNSHACGSKYGLLTIKQKGSGNSWGPGDWSAYPQWNGNSTNYRIIHDYQDIGYGGGYWRETTNGDYLYATPSCTSAG